MDVGQYGEALALLQNAIAADPLSRGAYEISGWTYLRLGRLAEAVSDSRRVLEFSPTSTSGHYDLGVFLVLERKADAALAEMAKETLVGGQVPGLALANAALHRTKAANRELACLEAAHSLPMARATAEVYAFPGQTIEALK